MLELQALLSELQYDQSKSYRHRASDFEPELAHLFRTVKKIGVHGVYVVTRSPVTSEVDRAPQPIVFLATAESEQQAREIHRTLWNLYYAPFLIVRLPSRINVYTGFSYSEATESEGLLGSATRVEDVELLLADLTAKSIDAGLVWKSEYARRLNPDTRVDEHLLDNLQRLGNELKTDGVGDHVAHALIGKYVFLRYLRERGIVSDRWLQQNGLDERSVFSEEANKENLRKLIRALSEFNGRIFPLDLDEPSLEDKHISWVASVFSGHEPIDSAPVTVWQLHLPFKAYNFRYIPVETLSAIYEQFLAGPDESTRRERGVIYTPEYLADYVISEIGSVKSLEKGMKVLDPACGSGIFLVLTYRRLIEMEIERLGRDLTPEELRTLLMESIYGVERERDACYVTEFGLILTLLHYSESESLERMAFRLPDLHNKRIFECDFFDVKGEACDSQFWQQGFEFDWIVGNPPWIELKPPKPGEIEKEIFARRWIEEHASEYGVAGNRVAEAFSWLVLEILAQDGAVGLILPATSLVNLESEGYRKQFFEENEVLHITNFTNFRGTLFGKENSGVLPAMTIVYRPAARKREKPLITHYAPFLINQIPTESRKEPWTIIINEDEIQTLSPESAAEGSTAFWKSALWGNQRDRRVLDYIDYRFPTKLKDIIQRKDWYFAEGIQLRNVNTSKEKLEHLPQLAHQKMFNTRAMDKALLQQSVPDSVLESIPPEKAYLRIRGGRAGLRVNTAPHIIISPTWRKYIAYSENEFVVPPRQMGIATGTDSKVDGKYLRALAVYLQSSLVAYYLFFHVPQWGVFSQRQHVVITQVKQVPMPDFSSEEVTRLASLHKELVRLERKQISALLSVRQQVDGAPLFDAKEESHDTEWFIPKSLSRHRQNAIRQEVGRLHAKIQARIDNDLFSLLKIPDDIQVLINEFFEVRLQLDTPSSVPGLIRQPSDEELFLYGRTLQNTLDNFSIGMARYEIEITRSPDLIKCTVQIRADGEGQMSHPRPTVEVATVQSTQIFQDLRKALLGQISQWVYVQRGLRLFEGSRVHIYKLPRLIDWTRSSAMLDADELVGAILAT